MRILHINCNYAATALHQLMIEKLDALGIKNEVFVPVYSLENFAIQPNKNVYISKCFAKWNRYLFDLKQARIIRAIEEHYDVSSFDLIHAYTVFTDGNCARVLSEKYKVPYVVAVRNTDVNAFFKKRILLRNRGREILRKANKVFFLSEAYQKEVLFSYIPDEMKQGIMNKSCIIPNGIDQFWLDNRYSEKRTIDKNTVKLVFAGGVDKNKNIIATQKAMEILRAKGITSTLTVVGKIIDHSIGKIVISDPYTRHIEKQPKEALIDFYRSNDIFVMPSFHESFGLVYAEALSQGLPVIYSKGQGFDAQFKDGYVGFSVEPGDPSSIANAIINTIRNYQIISDRCSKVVNKFNWQTIAETYRDVYLQLLMRNRM